MPTIAQINLYYGFKLRNVNGFCCILKYAYFPINDGFRCRQREGVGGNPVKVAELKEARDIACNLCTKWMATCGVAAEDRRQKGPIQGVTASHALNADN